MCFLIQLALEAERLFDSTIKDLGVTIDYFPDGRDPIPSISEYIEQVRIQLWDSAFFREFNVEKGIQKKNLKEQ